MPLLRIVNLEQRAGFARLLRDINLEVEKGEVFVVIGPTGSGKTTLLRILDLLDKPYAGDVYFDGVNLTGTSNSLTNVRRRMSMVFQKPIVFTGDVMANVIYPLRVRSVGDSVARKRAVEMLATVGLEGYGKRKAKKLSGGEAQRVALARAMITDPQLLLLDEPTANLDPASVRLIEELVLKFNKEKGVTVVMTTHDMSQGQRLAHRAGVLMQGELIQTGKPLEIFHAPEDIRVAGFVGIKNIMLGRVVSSESGIADVEISGRIINGISDLPAGSEVDVYIRPDDIVLSPVETASSARNTLPAKITNLTYSGSLCTVNLDCGFPLEALVTRKSAEEMGLSAGQNIYVSFKATAVRVLIRPRD